MVSSVIATDSDPVAIAVLIAYATFLPAAIYLTYRLRIRSRRAISILRRLHRLARKLLRDNAVNVRRLTQLGVEVRAGPVRFSAPRVSDDVNLSGAEISDDQQRRFEDFSAQDHKEQLERVVRDIKPILDSARRESFVSGLNIGLLIVGVVALFLGPLAILGAIIIVLDVLGKLIVMGLPKSAEEKANDLLAEATEKRQMFEELLRRKQLEDGQ